MRLLNSARRPCVLLVNCDHMILERFVYSKRFRLAPFLATAAAPFLAMDKTTKRVIFTPYKKELLVFPVGKYKNIIENKETNRVSLEKKTEAYIKIANEFNGQVGVTPRTHLQLKQLYFNMKKRATKQSSKHRMSLIKTGGGKNLVEVPNSLENRILAMGALSSPLTTTFDSDASILDVQDDIPPAMSVWLPFTLWTVFTSSLLLCSAGHTSYDSEDAKRDWPRDDSSQGFPFFDKEGNDDLAESSPVRGQYFTEWREAMPRAGYFDKPATSLRNEESSLIPVVKREGHSLSIVNPLDVLRQRLMLEMARRRMKVNQEQIRENELLLKNLGKRATSQDRTSKFRRHQVSDLEDFEV